MQPPETAAGGQRNGRAIIRVLLVCEYPHALSLFQRRLERNGCQCQRANSETDVARLLDQQQFDIVLSTKSMRGDITGGLSTILSDSQANLFCALPVEEGCLWLPVLRNGKECFGRPALRPSEFASELDEIVGEIRTQRDDEIRGRYVVRMEAGHGA